jgi:hypothetical protein
MGVIYLEAFRFFNLGIFGEKPLHPTVPVGRNRYSSALSPYLGASVAVAHTNDGDLRDAYR